MGEGWLRPQRFTRLLPKLYHNINIVLKCSTVSIINKFLYVFYYLHPLRSTGTMLVASINLTFDDQKNVFVDVHIFRIGPNRQIGD